MGNLLFLDIETTGTNPSRDLILEIGYILVDEHLREFGRDSIVIHHDSDDVLARMNDYVRDMHTKSGLLSEVIPSGNYPEAAGHWLHRVLSFADKPRVAGFSIHFDREFILAHWPALRSLVHHRVVDVSTIREEAKTSAPSLVAPDSGEVAHRTLADCERALYEYRWYREHVFERAASLPMMYDIR